MKSNILVLSAGRRVELVQAFKRDLGVLIPGGKVYCTDIYPELSSACSISDGAFAVPRATDLGYIERLIEICTENNIKLVVPTIDTELQVLSEHFNSFKNHNIHVLISDLTLIKKCRDKRQTSMLFSRLGINQPAIFNREKLSFPCFCKPYDGSSSKGAFPIFTEKELTKDILDNPKNMFMELIPKAYCEYTVDAYYSKEGLLKCLVPRKRLEVRGGEVSKGLTKKNFVYDYLIERTEVLEGARGCITYQLFVKEDEELVKGLEVNARFGGGYPLADAAGAKFTEYAIKEYLLDEELKFVNDWEANLLMLRYDAKVLQHGYS